MIKNTLFRNILFLLVLSLITSVTYAMDLSEVHANFSSLESHAKYGSVNVKNGDIKGDKSTISKVNVNIPIKSNNISINGSIFFIHFADIHLCNNSEVNEIFGGTLPPVNITRYAVHEALSYHPNCIISTGDIIALGDSHDLNTDEEWYILVNRTIVTPILNNGIPFLFAPGNHDPAAYKLKNVNKSDPRYYNGLMLKYVIKPIIKKLNISNYEIDRTCNFSNINNYHFGYSYNIGNYHFVMIDPVETPESGYRAVELPKAEENWLKSDLENNSNKYIIIAYHQPLGSWDNNSYNRFMNIISKYKGHVLLIAGHTHDNRVLYHNGIPEYQDGAVCGDWWQTGKTPDGYPIGYAIYYIKDGKVYRFYKGINLTKQINLLSPDNVILDKTYPIELNVYYENHTICNITYKIDNGKEIPLNITLINATKIYWYHAVGNITPTNYDNRNHNITIIVHANDGSSFNKTIVYKFSKSTIMPISEIINDTNFKNYYGRFVTINGTISMVA
ncbi:metallophosphoesterase family protein, partial [Methanocaldococcus sp.]